jgi:anti-sigma regulatory factor (Ser/Thr protein kinase)
MGAHGGESGWSMTNILEVSLPPEAGAAAAARQAIDGLADLRKLPQVAFDVRLLVSELVANSVRHAGLAASQPVRLVVDLTRGRLRCEIHDGGRGFTARGAPDAGSGEGGWGLHLVDRLTDRWGVDEREGTLVWFEIELAKRQ